jgi:hypothetical protein
MDHSYFFCPRPGCRAHRLDLSDTRWYAPHGHHDTKAFGRVPRYRCRYCGKTFSDQTFLLNYWLKKPTDFAALGREINSSASGNFVARHHGLSAESLRIRQDRLARNALFLQSLLTEALTIEEPVVADGLESFVSSQYFPISLNILIGKNTQFLYYFTESHSRRKGARTEEQQERSDAVYANKSFLGSRISLMFDKLLGYLEGRCTTQTVSLHTDEHPIYRYLIERWNNLPGQSPRIVHHQTPSTKPRTTGNRLFAVNYFDRLIRKDMPNHRRETICYARNDRNLLSRFAYYVVTHNFFKPYRVNSKARQPEGRHADAVVGCDERVQRWKSRLHEYRFFASFVSLPEYFEEVWFRRTPTPLRDTGDRVPAFAYQ